MCVYVKFVRFRVARDKIVRKKSAIQIKTFKIFNISQTVRAGAKNAPHDFYAYWCSLSNGVSPVFQPRDPDLNFHG